MTHIFLRNTNSKNKCNHINTSFLNLQQKSIKFYKSKYLNNKTLRDKLKKMNGEPLYSPP